MRPALSLGCLCFVLIGGPIGIWTNRADFLSSFVIGFLPAVMLYYPMVMCGTNLGKDGKILRVFSKVKPAGHAQEVLAAL